MYESKSENVYHYFSPGPCLVILASSKFQAFMSHILGLLFVFLAKINKLLKGITKQALQAFGMYFLAEFILGIASH
jgi:hypothetical protein